MEKLNLGKYGQSVQSFDPVEAGRLKAESFNKQQGDLKGYDCQKCLNRGRIAIVKEDGGVSFQECGCMKIRRCVQKMEASGLRDVIKSYTFDAYQDKEEWQSTIKRGAMDYAENPDGWLLFSGQSGCGKTHLCTAVCRNLLLADIEVRYMPWRRDMRDLKGKSKDLSSQSEAFKKYQEAPILYIDDLFKCRRTSDGGYSLSDADVNMTLDLIDYRYTKRLTTIISTELSPSELMEIDEATGGRIVEMALRHTYCIERKPGRNYRLRGVVTV